MHLKLHSRIHNNERPFTCLQCGRNYISLSGLRTHWKNTGCKSSSTKVSNELTSLQTYVNGLAAVAAAASTNTNENINNYKNHLIDNDGDCVMNENNDKPLNKLNNKKKNTLNNNIVNNNVDIDENNKLEQKICIMEYQSLSDDRIEVSNQSNKQK